MTFSSLQGKGGSWDPASSLSTESLFFSHNKITKLLTLGGSSSSLCQGHLELVAQDHNQASSEDLQGGRCYHFSGQCVAGPGYSYSQNCFLIFRQNFCISVCAHDTLAIYTNSRKQYSHVFPQRAQTTWILQLSHVISKLLKYAALWQSCRNMCLSSFCNSVSSYWSFTDTKFYFFNTDIYSTLQDHDLSLEWKCSSKWLDGQQLHSYEKYPVGNHIALCSFHFNVMKLFFPSPSSSQFRL